MDDDDDLRRLLGPVTPLEPPPGALERISRTARHRRRIRTITSVTAATTAVVVLAVGGVVAQQRLGGSGDRSPAVTAAGPSTATRSSTDGAPHPARSGAPTTPVGGPANHAGTPAAPTRAAATCTAGQLSVSVGDESDGHDESGQVLVFRNVSSTGCALADFPGVDLEGTPVVHAQRSGFLLWENPPAEAVLLPPGGDASAGIEWPDTTASDTTDGCPSYQSIDVTPPGLRAATSLDLPLSVTLCSPSTLRVTRLIAGDAGPNLQ